MILHVDYETYCELNIRARNVNAHIYAAHESCEILIAAWRVDDGPVQSWDTLDGGPIADFHRAIVEADEIIAHNAAFERLVSAGPAGRKLWGYLRPDIPIEKWRCTSVVASALGLPPDLDRAAKYLQVSPKDKEGSRLIQKFSKPRKPTKNNPNTRNMPADFPEEFRRFAAYCRQDVVAESEAEARMRRHWLSDFEWWLYAADQRMNDLGTPIDLPTVRAARRIIAEYSRDLETECHELTGGINHSQTAKLTEWAGVENLQAATIDELLASGELPPDVHRVLEIRRSLGRTSVKKLEIMEQCIDGRNRIPGCYRFYGAHTGRWSGQLLQPQNLPRPEVKETAAILRIVQRGDLPALELAGDPMAQISSIVRHLICAPPGREFLDADYSSIEARVLCWLADQDDAMRLYRAGMDAYVDMAAHLYGKQVEDVTDNERGMGKAVVLGCGFQMGARTFVGDVRQKWGLVISEEVAQDCVSTFRERYHKVKQLWYDVENAAIRALNSREDQKCGKLWFGVRDIWLICQLPSKRRLYYPYPQMGVKTFDNGSSKPCLEYLGQVQGSVNYRHISTYGGKLVENAVQAIARDIMAHGWRNAESDGYEIVGTVHDELIAEVDEGARDLKEFCDTITRLPAWADGLPIAASGWRGKRYRKD